MKNLIRISLRQDAIYVSNKCATPSLENVKVNMSRLHSALKAFGYIPSVELTTALESVGPDYHAEILQAVSDATGIEKNWTPLVKGWDKPTGESFGDHILTMFANVFGWKGTRLACGHTIPRNTFQLERYNGCPYCGTQFETNGDISYGQGSKLKVLGLWTNAELENYFRDLVLSRTALDATQVESLKVLVKECEIPTLQATMKETQMILIDAMVESGKLSEASAGFKSPSDVLRYLWYRHTGLLQVTEPSAIRRTRSKNSRNLHAQLHAPKVAGLKARADLRLKYKRKESRMVAAWLNDLNLDAEKCCEHMHAKRGMWVRMIRALRLAEYAGSGKYEHLKKILDLFYNERYQVWEGNLAQCLEKNDAPGALRLLKQRPGTFARRLFSLMLHLKPEVVLPAFADIAGQLPARLLLTLAMYTDFYFEHNATRVIKPVVGAQVKLPGNPKLNNFDAEQLRQMISQVKSVCLQEMRKRFEKAESGSSTMYIAPELFRLPLPIGDRAAVVQDLSATLQGTRFKVEGNTIRLFMQWGAGLHAQHLDMDLSCSVSYEKRNEYCSFSNLAPYGCRHSGDIRHIPHKVGTAEYIDIDIDRLSERGARYVTFTCNAYTNGSIAPQLVVGWMNSRHPMTISATTGVAYDPSTVQHQVRVTNSLAKGMVFGVLDVESREIVWIESAFEGQVVQNMDFKLIASMIRKIDSKISIGELLQLKAEAQHLQLVNNSEADESYSRNWAMDTAKVTQLLID